MNISLAERLMGHSVTVALDNVYLDVNTEQLFNEFKKVIPELTVDDTERQKIAIKKLKSEQTQVEQLKQQLEEHKRESDKKLAKLEFENQDANNKLGSHKDLIIQMMKDENFKSMLDNVVKKLNERKPFVKEKDE